MGSLTIVKASAGSGKTFRLTGEYIKLLFAGSDNYRHILAVTFTNKATEEMKSRIIKELSLLAGQQPSPHLDDIMKYTGLPERSVRLKAAVILKNILHDYSRFSVGTIDSFFQKVLRSFTREVGVQSGYSIELDESKVLEQAVDNLFLETDSDEELRKWLVQFAGTKIEDGRSWNFKYDLLQLGGEIFKESFKEFSENIIKKIEDRDFLNNYRDGLYKIKSSFESDLTKLGEEGLKIMVDHQLTINDFPYKDKGAAAIFQKLAGKDFSPPGKRFRETVEDVDKWYTKSSYRKTDIQAACNNGLSVVASKIIQCYDTRGKDYITADLILKNLFTLGILSDITKQIVLYLADNNLFLLSDASRFINRIIDGNDTPFIYERVGDFYHHFMIDEFQDTSLFQWNNFRPLLSNSLSNNYDNLVVGDVKQSIYRWRNSNWEILANLVSSDFQSASLKTEHLEKNWRSNYEIVGFNNSLFFRASKILQQLFDDGLSDAPQHFHELYANIITDLYNDVIQKIPEFAGQKNKGYINVRFFDKENKREDIKRQTIETILQLREKGFGLHDIAILVRSKRDGKEIAEYILNNNSNEQNNLSVIDVISDEALLLGSSTAVRFIIAVMYYMLYPENNINQYYLVSEYLNYINSGVDKPDYEGFSKENGGDYVSAVNRYFPENFHKDLETFKNLPLYELTENIIRYFSLNQHNGELPYIQAFLDMVHDYTRERLTDLYTFLDFWEEKGQTTSISLPEVKDAVRILTIHKSKGLEFKAVIIPFCDWDLDASRGNNTILWCRPGEKPYNELNVVPVAYSSKLKDSLFGEEYFTEKLKNFIDNLNLLYVACTRAKTALFCMAGQDDNPKNDKISNVADLMRQVFVSGLPEGNVQNELLISLSGHYNAEKSEFELGLLQDQSIENISSHAEKNWFYPVSDTSFKLRVLNRGHEFLQEGSNSRFRPLNYGRLMHHLFENIKTKEDVVVAVETVMIEGLITGEEKEQLTLHIKELLDLPVISNWFGNDWKVINEADILIPGGEIRRPDRVLVKDEAVIVIDFKFGEQELPQHDRQVQHYMDALRSMGLENVKGYLWYPSLEKVKEVIR